MDSVLEEERFEQHLKELAAMTDDDKRRYAKVIDQREEEFAAAHLACRIQHECDRVSRAIETELRAEENGTDN